MDHSNSSVVAIIGAGPAGLMAAERIADAGYQVHVYDAMPSAGRKFLLAGKSGMNLTHSEAFEKLLGRYRERSEELHPYLEQHNADQIRLWAKGLGVETFVGSSGRVFPVDMKAAPLLRAWLHRLRSKGVHFHMRHKWISGFGAQHTLMKPEGKIDIHVNAIVFAMGGASWKRLGSDAGWVSAFEKTQLLVKPFLASNCGFVRQWTTYFSERFAGVPLTNVQAMVKGTNSESVRRQGQFVITEKGVEGSLIYALSADLRRQLQTQGYAELLLDLLPGKSDERVMHELSAARGSRSLSSHLRSKLGLHPVHCALLHEVLPETELKNNAILAGKIKALPLRFDATSPIDEAISCAGGVDFAELDDKLMLKKQPGWFCAGEMLDWDAPTGGYLLTACFATGLAAALGVIQWLGTEHPHPTKI